MISVSNNNNNNHKREMRDRIIKQQCIQRNLRQKRREYQRDFEQYKQQNKTIVTDCQDNYQKNTHKNENHDEYYDCLEKMFIHEKKHFIMLNRIIVWIIYTISHIFLAMTNILDAVMDTFIENVFCSIILVVFSYLYAYPDSMNAIIDNANISSYIPYIHKNLLCYL
jgi:hypothetical protein